MCDKACVYFPNEADVEDSWVEDGLKHRKVRRVCGYSCKKIENWHDCYRKNGPKFKEG